MGLRLRPRRGQMLEEVRLADHEEAIARYFLQPDLRRSLPPSRSARDALGLLCERSLGEQLKLTHGTADTRPQTPSPVVALIKSACSSDRIARDRSSRSWRSLGLAHVTTLITVRRLVHPGQGVWLWPETPPAHCRGAESDQRARA